MRPLPWSPSSLDTFKNCPKQYHEKYIGKTMPQELQGPEQAYGEWVHKEFQTRQEDPNYRLVLELSEHEPFMKHLQKLDGDFFCEQKIGFDRKAQPCSWEHRKDIWFRGMIDYYKVNRDAGTALAVDYKTGKPHSKFTQLALYAIWIFTAYPFVNTVEAHYYWTKTTTTTHETYTRAMVDELWLRVTPDLLQYAEAFKTGIWQARPSGLCNGWCPLKTCNHWKPKRTK